MYIAYMYMHVSYINNINYLLDISANNIFFTKISLDLCSCFGRILFPI